MTALFLGCGGSSASGAETILILAPDFLVEEAGELLDWYPGLEFVTYSNPREMLDRIVDYQAVMGWNLTAEALRADPNLRWVHCSSGGVDGILRIPELRDDPNIVLISMKIQNRNRLWFPFLYILAPQVRRNRAILDRSHLKSNTGMGPFA